MTNKITHNGKQYEIGRLYHSFSGIGVLKGVNSNKDYFVLGDNSGDWDSGWIEVIDDGDTAGTITDAPIELEEGCWYMINDVNNIERAVYFDGFMIVDHKGSEEAYLDYEILYKMERAK